MTDLILTEVDYGELVTCGGDEPTTDSVRVAKRFGKRHDNVLRDRQRQMFCNFRLLNLRRPLIDEQGKVQRMFNMTKDGFMFVVMGFTGEKGCRLERSVHRGVQQDGPRTPGPFAIDRAATSHAGG